MDFYGTIGPACADVKLLQQMVEAGMTGIRMNLSHGPLAAHKDWLVMLHKAGVKKLLIDLQGPELRISAAAALVNVTIKRRSMSTGCSLSVMIFMIRSTSTAVLPEPAAAETNIFLSLSSMTFRWSSVHVIPMFCSVSDFLFLHLSHHIYSPSGFFPGSPISSRICARISSLLSNFSNC